MNILDVFLSDNLSLTEKMFGNNYPLYYQGREVGVFSNIEGTCQGKIVLKNGEKIEPQFLVVGTFLNRKVPLSQFCVDKGFTPQWAATNAQDKTLTYTAPDGGSVVLKQTPTGEYKAPDSFNRNYLYAGAAMFAALLILRR